MTRAADIVRAIIAPLTRTRFWHRCMGPWCCHRSSGFVARITGGRVQLSALLVPSLVLHTVGAKSGEPRDAPLMYTPDGQGRAIVAGTNFAGARHPAWTANLLAHPDAAITVRGRRMAVRATRCPTTSATRLGAHRGAMAGLPRLRAGVRPHGTPVPAAAGALTWTERAAQGFSCATVRGRTISQSESTPPRRTPP